jgi:hypothetical protein
VKTSAARIVRGRGAARAEGGTLFPDKVQHAVLRRRSGIVPNSAPGTVPGLQRTTEEVLRCARDKRRSYGLTGPVA